MKAYILTMKTFLAYILILEDDVLDKQIKFMDEQQ